MEWREAEVEDEVERKHCAHHLARNVGEKAGETEQDYRRADADVEEPCELPSNRARALRPEIVHVIQYKRLSIAASKAPERRQIPEIGCGLRRLGRLEDLRHTCEAVVVE